MAYSEYDPESYKVELASLYLELEKYRKIEYLSFDEQENACNLIEIIIEIEDWIKYLETRPVHKTYNEYPEETIQERASRVLGYDVPDDLAQSFIRE